MTECAVLYATDVNHWPHVYVSLYSLLVSNRHKNWRAFIICDAEDETFVSRIPFLNSLGNLAELNLCPGEWVTTAFDNARPLPWHQSTACFWRLMLARVVPESVDRILYLDADTIVTRPLEDLFAFDLGGKLLAAAPNGKWWPWPTPEGIAELGLPPNAPYFNSGVMLIDLDKWRATDAETVVLRYIATNPERLMIVDQDALNGAFHDDWAPLQERFNYQITPGYRLGARPSIVHYAGPKKPWSDMTGRYPASIYWRHRQKTPYKINKTNVQLVTEWRNRAAQLVNQWTHRAKQAKP
jgi:lipopolysaccharide biosynthesis glycosyltransferase